MNLKEIKKRLISLKNKGFVPSQRKGSGSVGHTLEQELGLSENNLAIPDISGRVELKATRRQSNSMITLFTLDRDAWKLHQREVIKKYGYIDRKNRQALQSRVSCSQCNSRNLKIKLDKTQQKTHLYHNSGDLLATWSIYTIIGKFESKLKNLLIVFADTQCVHGKESFLFNKAYLLKKTSPECFLKAFENSQIAVELRMYLEPEGSVRNRGTAFRIKESDMIHLYKHKQQIL